MFGGTWNLQLETEGAAQRNLIGPMLTYGITDGMNISNITYAVRSVTAQINGNVHDTNSNPITFVNVGASVTVNGTNYSAYGRTDGSGNYSLGVFNGTWSVNVSSDDLSSRGFETPTNQNVTISGGNVTVDFTIHPIQPLQITTTSLPPGEISRNYHTNLQATGGQQPYNWSLVSGSTPPGVIFGSGLIDGITTTNVEQESGIQIPLYTPSIDDVQEFKVQQSNFSAEIGFSGATVINMVTRSGTNSFHGSAYDFVRNNILTANDWFNDLSGLPLAARRRNVFGATIGGPIRKDKTFFFFDYEGTRDRQAHTLRGGVPNPFEKQGDFGELCGYAGGTFDTNGMCSSPDGQLWDPYVAAFDPDQGGPVRQAFIPFNNLKTYTSPGNPNLNGTPFQLTAVAGNLIDPVAFKMMQFFPDPNLALGTAGSGQYDNWISTATTPSNNDQWDIKIDHSFSEKDRLSGKFSRALGNSREPNCFKNPGDACSNGPNFSHSHVFSLTHNHTFNPNTLLNVTFGFARSYGVTGAGGLADYPGFDPIKDLGLPAYMARSGVPSTPSIYISDYFQPGRAWSSQTTRSPSSGERR